jgi:thiol-disulfide isomerase/thioredoxin
MKRILYFALIGLVAVSCGEKKLQKTSITGIVSNYSDTIVRITSKGITDTVFINSEGNFKYDKMISQPIYLSIRIGRPTLTVYLAPGETLQIKHDFANKINEVAYEGTLAVPNQKVAQTNSAIKAAMPDFRGLYSQPICIFEAKIDSIKQLALNILASEDLKDYKAFVKFETNRINYQMLSMQLDYPFYNANFTSKELKADSIDFPYMAQLDLNNQESTQIPEYLSLVNKYVYSLHTLNLEKNKNRSNFETKVMLFDLTDSLITNQEINDFIKMESAMEAINFESLDDAKNAAELFLKSAKTPEYISIINGAHSKRMLLAPGKHAPTFTLTGIDGKEYSLSDFTGNLVYIDFWATWCRPCREQIPHFAKVKELYVGKPIVFVAISVDDDIEAWKKMVNEQGLKGIQVHADKAWSSDVVKNYQIKGIPTFVLIDQTGNIIEYNAPRPSSTDLTMLIDKYIK